MPMVANIIIVNVLMGSKTIFPTKKYYISLVNKEDSLTYMFKSSS